MDIPDARAKLTGVCIERSLVRRALAAKEKKDRKALTRVYRKKPPLSALLLSENDEERYAAVFHVWALIEKDCVRLTAVLLAIDPSEQDSIMAKHGPAGLAEAKLAEAKTWVNAQCRELHAEIVLALDEEKHRQELAALAAQSGNSAGVRQKALAVMLDVLVANEAMLPDLRQQ